LAALETALPKVVVAPSFMVMVVFIYGFILWTLYLSMTKSSFLPSYDFVGLAQYAKLWRIERWGVAVRNLLVYGGLFIFFCTLFGLLLAIFLDQKIRIEGALRTVYLYPMALSFVVTGTAWKWLLNPGLGIERLVREWGWSTFTFDWLVTSEMSIYCVVIAGSGSPPALSWPCSWPGCGALTTPSSRPPRWTAPACRASITRIIIPSLRPVFFSTFIILMHIAIKSFDLVVVLTRGGPGYASDLPATFMYSYAFTRGRLALGAASAMMMFFMVMAIIVPYLYSELRRKQHA
jgi:glucose/mannose transport system permease protein